MSAPLVTVLVVNYNAGGMLADCLDSLAAQTFREFETLVVDNASIDGSLDAIRQAPPGLRVLRQATNTGFAGGNNIGAREGRGRWLALLNPDAVAAPDWLEKLVQAAENRPEFQMVASLQVDLVDAARLDGVGDCYTAYGYAWRGGYGAPLKTAPPAGECFSPCGAAALYPREAFLASGGFDERYFCYHEDVDMGFRLRLMGLRCQFAPQAVVRHAGSAIAGRRSRFAIYHGVRNGVWTYLKNMPAPLLAVTLPMWAAGAVALLVRGALIGQFSATLQGFGDGLVQMAPVMKERARVQAARTASLSAVAAAMTWNPLDYVQRRPVVKAFPPGRA